MQYPARKRASDQEGKKPKKVNHIRNKQSTTAKGAQERESAIAHIGHKREKNPFYIKGLGHKRYGPRASWA